MRANVHPQGLMALAFGLFFGLFPVSEALACSWDLNGVGYPASCGYRGGGGGGGNTYVAPAPYVPPPPSPAEIAARQAFPINENGIKAEKAGNYALAVSLFEQAVRLSPNDATMANNLRHARAQVVNSEGLQAARAGNWTLALTLFDQAFRLMPSDHFYDVGRATLRRNIQETRNRQQEQEGRAKQLEQDKIAAANMEKSIQGLAQSLSPAPSSAGLDFNGAKPGNNPAPSGELSFIVPTPAGAGTSATNNNSAPPNVVQLNPGAKFETAPAVKVEGAIQSSSAREQLFNSQRELTGQLFDNGRGHDDTKVLVDPKSLDVTTPSSQPVDARLAKSKDYQAAATDLSKAQAAADALNKKMATLLGQQATNPTPERQAEIYNLSGDLHQAGGAVAVATIALNTVKKKIIQDGPAIVVEADMPATGQPAPTPAPTPAPVSDSK
jgi:tetratricopeptide (TPR) repeat protein